MFSKQDIVQSAILEAYSTKISNRDLSESEKTDILFDCTLQFIISHKWKYDGKGRDDHSVKLLRVAVDQPQTVNCFDLSNMFVKLCNKSGIKGAASFNYINKPTKTIGKHFSSDCPPLQCFDGEIKFNDNQCMFDIHSAVRCNGKFYDLTFSTHYKHVNDPYDVSPYGMVLSCMYSGLQLHAMRILKSKKINLLQIYDGYNLLHIAALFNMADIAGYLLQCKPVLATQRVSGSQEYININKTAIELVENDNETFALLKKYSDKEAVTVMQKKFEKANMDLNFPIALIDIENNDLPSLECCIESGLNINYQDQDGHTLLHQAALFEQANIYKWLLKHGADPELQRKDGNKPRDFLPKTATNEVKQKSNPRP